MLTRTLLGRSRSVGVAPLGDRARSASFAPYGFTSPLTRTHVETPWSVFSRRVEWEPRGQQGARALRSTPKRALSPRSGGGIPRAYQLPGFGRLSIRLVRARVDRRTGSRRSTSAGASSGPIRFPPDNFKHSLTLFSKSFSSFPRGTCSLSVSRPYLALDGIYRPIGAAFPNNPTRKTAPRGAAESGTAGLSPSPASLSGGLGPSAAEALLGLQFGRRSPVLKLAIRFARRY
ncbi:hypothetical protein DH2020_003934 [Rehmannia glutinosa]|uniref:Protein TAR1 n=1 Tax=Rehmannia glutinosa TaxID=99300 RepID=A0ABR0XN54_REHGL